MPESGETVQDIWAEIGNCTRCPLFEGRTQVVHTTGNFNADLMFIGEAPGADEDAQGEPFLHPPAQPPLSDQELALRFGADFAAALAPLPAGAWQGPIPSAYGQHLVYVVERTPAGLAPFERVREPVRLGFLAERRARVLAEELARMRAEVEVVVEGASVPDPRR